ncbi:hypothetical protein JR316_0012958 [Psilocybe cubensis]|uniref:Uncharacterized protein n=2 Tax=Psilocybe cubensis TaxID=181762 RepID=A0ACB8GFR7_PSICU|nr:hypothetical protein JR316_0012958 [Psilocybe cubensis]KAH9474498.1 hypothetical protein JR316_0012958 [Psilocybe cubensis]
MAKLGVVLSTLTKHPTVVNVLLTNRTQAYFTVATACCLVYDHLTTLSDEVEMIWKHPGGWNLVKILFFMTRYVAVAGQLALSYGYAIMGYSFYSVNKVQSTFVRILQVDVDVQYVIWGFFVDQTELYVVLPQTHFLVFHRNTVGHDYQLFLRIQGYAMIIPLFCMHGIMMYRISSMYSHKRKIIILLISGFAVEIVSALTMFISTDVLAYTMPDPSPGIHICLRVPKRNFIFVAPIIIVLFESLLFTLSLYRGLHYYRLQKSVPKCKLQPPHSLGTILFRDSIVFPFFTVTFLIASIVAMASLPMLAIQITYTITAAWPAIAGPRLILNLREVYYKSFKDECDRSVDYNIDIDLIEPWFEEE